MLDMMHYTKLPLQNFTGNYHVQRSLPGKSVINQTHPRQTSHLILVICTFVLSSNQCGAAMSVQWLGYMLEDFDRSKRNISSPKHSD